MMNDYNFEGLPNYENPPIEEVVFGIFFQKLKAMKLPYSGIFWEKIRKNFPKCTHAAPLGISVFEENELPLPRVWFISEDETTLIQNQIDCFLFNWRRMPEAEEYPRYLTIKNLFERYRKDFEEFVQKNKLGKLDYQQCELTYINHILKDNGWSSLADIGKIMRDVKWANKNDRFLPEPKSIQWGSTFSLPEDFGSLRISLKYGTRQPPDNTPLFVLEISAKGLGGDRTPERISEWFDLAHKWIVKAFADITNEDIQKRQWCRQENKIIKEGKI